MADLNTALIAFVGVLAGGYVNNFVAEDFRRFRDSQALAAALVGELDSHASAVDELKPALKTVFEIARSGQPLSLQELPMASSPIFEANVEKIGLLGSKLANDVAFVYEQIRAFRVAFHQLSIHHKEMTPEWRAATVTSCEKAIDRATNRGKPLLASLASHAKKRYWKHFVVENWGAVLVSVAIGAAIVGGVHYAAASDATQCITTLDHGTLHTVCK